MRPIHLLYNDFLRHLQLKLRFLKKVPNNEVQTRFAEMCSHFREFEEAIRDLFCQISKAHCKMVELHLHAR